MKKQLIIVAILILSFQISLEQSWAVDFNRCVSSLKTSALKAGVSKQIVNHAFTVAKPKKEVVKKAQKQPEFVTPIWQYLENAVSPHRLKYGKEKLAANQNLFEALEVLYGVNRHVLAAIWGMETSYGAFQGKHNAIQSLVSLACYDSKRSDYAQKQLIAALKILERGDITLEKMESSWAGAMGQSQFIPTTYEAYAVDVDGDNRRDIWNSTADALGSAANYLRERGWRSDLPWGFEVKLPANFDYSLNDRDHYREGTFWHKKGVRLMNGKAIPYQNHDLALLAPVGAQGPAFILTKNFKSILAYNRSTAYAISIGHLGDRLAGHQPFSASWPVKNAPLTFSERKALQVALKKEGLYSGEIDGMIGSGSIAAIKIFQSRHGMNPDGYAGKELLAKIK